MSKRFGRFSKDGSQFEITTPDTPRDWYNYLWNDRYVALFSQTAQGESLRQDPLGRRIDVVASRMVFVRDRKNGNYQNLNGLPVDAKRDSWRCTHGLGDSEIRQAADGLESSFRCFVPTRDACEIWTVRLRNTGSKTRQLTAFFYFNTTFDGVFRPQYYYPGKGSFDPKLNSVIIRKRQEFDGADEARIFLSLDHPIGSYDGAVSGFVGHGTEQRPAAVLRGHCGNTGSEMEKSCCAAATDFSLRPGQEIVLQACAGGGIAKDEIARLRRRYFAAGRIERELAAVRSGIRKLLGANAIATPDPLLNRFFHPWLKRQISLGIQWARVRHNGYRDQMQDIWAFTRIDPAEAERQLHRVLSYQYSNGYAPRTWLGGKILDKDFSDNHVWIGYAIYQLVMETGDPAILKKPVPFNDGSSASVYEHCKRALDFYWQDRGLFGLLKIRSGDWNDCLQLVGPKGQGVSVWLSMAWYLANAQFAELAGLTGHRKDAATARQRGEEMRRLVDQHAWDGQWYLRALNDDGEPLGSHRNREGQLFLLPQAWAVLSGIAVGNRGAKAMDAAARLLEIDLGTTKVLKPFTHWDPKIGESSVKTPGTHENGGVYLHACAFKLMADCQLKRHEAVAMAIHKMLPFDHRYRAKSCEPYVFSNSYFANEGGYRYGSAGQSWGTGSAGWFYAVMLDHVFGLHPEFAGLRIDPCLPPEWRRCAVLRRFRGAEYRVTFDQSAGHRRIAAIRLDGKPFTGTHLPCRKGARYRVLVKMK